MCFIAKCDFFRYILKSSSILVYTDEKGGVV